MRPRAGPALLLLLFTGCLTLGSDDPRCGEVRRLADGAWLLPTASASQPLPGWEARVESALWRDWRAAFEPSACGAAVTQGGTAPWVGPVLHAGESDAVTLLLVNRTEANVLGGAWRVEATGGGAVDAAPTTWEGAVHETRRLAFVATAAREGAGHLRVQVTGPTGVLLANHTVEYLVRSGTEGEPHRLRP